jgi:hypothetical protein
VVLLVIMENQQSDNLAEYSENPGIEVKKGNNMRIFFSLVGILIAAAIFGGYIYINITNDSAPESIDESSDEPAVQETSTADILDKKEVVCDWVGKQINYTDEGTILCELSVGNRVYYIKRVEPTKAMEDLELYYRDSESDEGVLLLTGLSSGTERDATLSFDGEGFVHWSDGHQGMGGAPIITAHYIIDIVTLNIQKEEAVVSKDINFNPEPAAPLETPSEVIVQCGDSWDCMIQAASSCSNAHAKIRTEFDFLGATVGALSDMRIDKVGDKCRYAQHTLESYTIIDGVRNEAPEGIVGMKGSCIFTMSNLTKMFTEWSKGNASTDDTYGATSCTGSLSGEQRILN